MAKYIRPEINISNINSNNKSGLCKRREQKFTIKSAVSKCIHKPILQGAELRWKQLRPGYAADRSHRSRTLLLLLLVQNSISYSDGCFRVGTR